MPSQSFLDLEQRLKDIDQLLKAHSAITQFKKAEQAAKKAGGDLKQIANVVNALVTQPGRGKPVEVDVINRAAFVLLTAHFQGFIDDLHKETANIVLSGKVSNVDDIIKLVKPRNANPHVGIIEQMFSGLGVYEVMRAISWQRCSNKSVKDRLTKYIETRNKLAHGKREKITKQKVKQYKSYIEMLAEKMDGVVREKVKALTGNYPWS
ncbi:MAG TPA: HEPN domain-containing protein [Blastocatellia bacterium]|nr:HEPN domain-containing protein [Blastocatellia bacterium]HMX25467.1 HEPN domain-containing protein [Blastocatellia bacterium]HMY70204.1 HEPN domain-containing protein [Blastocatellia bacterium]HNG31413.1 HEPN domain-containing protein [Blastocatellia bacterium]